MNYLFKNLKKGQANKRGDTIVEVLIGLSILALILTTAYLSSNRSLQVGTNAGNRSQALSYSQKQAELIKDAANSSDQTRYLNYIQHTNGTHRNPDELFCIDDTRINDKGGVIEIPPLATVCPADALNQGIDGQYQTGIAYDWTSNLFTITTHWPGATPNQQQLTLRYRPVTPRPKVIVTISAATPVPVHTSTSIIWTEKNAEHCEALNSNPGGMTNPWQGNKDSFISAGGATENSGTFNVLGDFTFTIHCWNPDSDASMPKTVTVTPPDPPVIQISTNPSSAYFGQSYPDPSTTVNWQVTGVDLNGCTASGETGWSGSRAYSGTQPFTYPGLSSARTYRYTLTCTNTWGGSTVEHADFTVSPEPLVPHLDLIDGTYHLQDWQCSYSGLGFNSGSWRCGGYNTGYPFSGDWSCEQDPDLRQAGTCPGNRRPHALTDITGTCADEQNEDGTIKNDGTHRWTECRGSWYARSHVPGDPTTGAGVGPVVCRMVSNNRVMSRDPGHWAGGLPISPSVRNFPGAGWAKSNQTPSSYDVPAQLTIKCQDFANQVATDCMPRVNPCPVDDQGLAPELICDPAYTSADIDQDVTLSALGGTAPFTWSSTGIPPSGSANTYTVHWSNNNYGLKTVTLRDNSGQVDHCSVRVVN